MSTTQDAIAVPQVFAATQAIQSGTFYYGFLTNPTEWNLDKGSGDREFDAEIKFPRPFVGTPTVVLTLTGLDASNTANTRVTIVSRDVTPADFEVLVHTWSDSKVYSVWGSWIAYGA